MVSVQTFLGNVFNCNISIGNTTVGKATNKRNREHQARKTF